MQSGTYKDYERESNLKLTSFLFIYSISKNQEPSKDVKLTNKNKHLVIYRSDVCPVKSKPHNHTLYIMPLFKFTDTTSRFFKSM